MTPSSNAAEKVRSATEYRIGRYRVRARLGKGGMGVVYLGRDEALDRDVAIKTLRADGSNDDESRGRFEIEAKAAARLQHPNIVTVFELGEDRGLPYIAMELLGGDDLETLLRSRERLGVAERLDIAIGALRGLDFAHAHQIVHRDIKPSNIRVLDDGGVKILDFGIAKVESTAVTRAGMMVGTPFYMSPEHIRGGVLDGRSDVFAMGVILHELFAGARPFTADDPTRVLYRIVNEPHPRLRAEAAGTLTEDVQRVIDEALEKDADSRYSSAAQMADALARVRARCPAVELKGDDLAALSVARKTVASGRTDETLLQQVESIARQNLEAADAHRLSRTMKRRPFAKQAAAETAVFPELDATFAKAASPADETDAMSATVRGRAETILQGSPAPSPGITPASMPQPPSSNPKLIWIGGATVGVIVVGIGFAMMRSRTAPEGSASPKPTPSVVEVIVPMTEPTASRRPLNPPVAMKPGRATAQNAPAAVNRPTAALSAGVGSPAIPAPVVPKPIPEGPPSTLVIESPYPVTVTTAGRVLASEKTTSSLTLSAGPHEILLESASVFLRLRQTVQLEAGGSLTIRPPGTGKIGVRANPDNCKVFIDGVFVDYPPILDRTIVAGTHLVAFEWPGGGRSEERVHIQTGKPSYIQGRKP